MSEGPGGPGPGGHQGQGQGQGPSGPGAGAGAGAASAAGASAAASPSEDFRDLGPEAAWSLSSAKQGNGPQAKIGPLLERSGGTAVRFLSSFHVPFTLPSAHLSD